MFLSLFVFLFSLFSVRVTGNSTDIRKLQPEKLLLHNLFLEYDKNVRPVVGPGEQTVHAKVSYDIHRIVDMDVNNQVLKVYGWLTMEWTDQLLQWDPEDFSNITKVYIPPQEIWKPDLEIYNSATEDVSFSHGTSSVVVRANGSTAWIERKTISTMCPADVTYFPFDQQRCKIHIGSWVHHGLQIELDPRTDKVHVEASANLGLWKVVSAHIRKLTSYYGEDIPPYMEVHVDVILQRKPMHLVCTLILPWILLSIIAVLCLSLPLESSKRIAIQFFTFVALSMFLSISDIPHSSKSTPLILIYMVTMMMLSGLSVFATIGLLVVFNRGKDLDSHPVPNWLRWALCNVMISPKTPTSNPSSQRWTVNETGSTILLREEVRPINPSTLANFGEVPTNVISNAGEGSAPSFSGQRVCVSDDWKQLASRLDTLCFWGFALIILLVNLSLVVLVL